MNFPGFGWLKKRHEENRRRLLEIAEARERRQAEIAEVERRAAQAAEEIRAAEQERINQLTIARKTDIEALVPDRTDLIRKSDGAGILLLIDIQPGFVQDEHPQFFQAVENEVRCAMQLGWQIIVVELVPHKSYGETWFRIMRLLANYTPLLRAYKTERDGSVQVLEACGKCLADTVRAVGVYSEQCLQDTVVSLADHSKNSRFEVVPAGCLSADESIGGAKYDWNRFPLRQNISLVSPATVVEPVAQEATESTQAASQLAAAC